MKEKVKLLTLCGCSRMVEITASANSYICPIQLQAQTISLAEKKEPFPEMTTTYKPRLFRYQGKKTKDTQIRIFEETT